MVTGYLDRRSSRDVGFESSSSTFCLRFAARLSFFDSLSNFDAATISVFALNLSTLPAVSTYLIWPV